MDRDQTWLDSAGYQVETFPPLKSAKVSFDTVTKKVFSEKSQKDTLGVTLQAPFSATINEAIPN